MFKVEGTLIDTTRERDSKPIDGEQVSWDFTQMHVLVGREVVKVRLPKGVHAHNHANGDLIELACTVRGQRLRIETDLESIGLAPANV